MRCPKCDAEDATEIVINLTEDDTVKFFQCRDCEAKWWEHGGAPIELDDVLDLTAKSESSK